MSKKLLSPMPSLTKWSLVLSGLAVVIFAAGLLTGGTGNHQPGEEWSDLVAFVFCRVLSPALACSGWLAGLVAILVRPQGAVWSIVVLMMLTLILLALFCYTAWLGSAAFHPNPLVP